MNRKPSISAFSLLELLAAVVVIGLLTSLILPALSRARSKARQVVCVNNLHQLGIAAQLYWDDHSGRTFSYTMPTPSPATGDLYWFGWLERGSEGTRQFDRKQSVLYPYLGGPGVELCPSLDYKMPYFKRKALGAAYGYGYNIQLSPAPGELGLCISDITAPSRLAVFADSAQVNTFQPPASTEHPMLEEFYYISSDEPTTHFRHNERADALSADIHVEARRPASGSRDYRIPPEILGSFDSEAIYPQEHPATRRQ